MHLDLCFYWKGIGPPLPGSPPSLPQMGPAPALGSSPNPFPLNNSLGDDLFSVCVLPAAMPAPGGQVRDFFWHVCGTEPGAQSTVVSEYVLLARPWCRLWGYRREQDRKTPLLGVTLSPRGLSVESLVGFAENGKEWLDRACPRVLSSPLLEIPSSSTPSFSLNFWALSPGLFVV